MTQPTAPTLTPVVGVPATITKRDALTGLITYDGPYLGGPAGAGIGSVPIAWNTGTDAWKNSNTNAPLQLPLARADIEGASAPDGWLLVDLTWIDEGGVRQSEQLRYRPQAGPDGLLDLTRDQAPAAVVATPDLLGAIEQAALIPARIADLDDALNAIPGQVSAGLAPVADSLAGIAQIVDEVRTDAATVLAALNTGAERSSAPVAPRRDAWAVPRGPVAPSGWRVAGATASHQPLMKLAAGWNTPGEPLGLTHPTPAASGRVQLTATANTGHWMMQMRSSADAQQWVGAWSAGPGQIEIGIRSGALNAVAVAHPDMIREYHAELTVPAWVAGASVELRLWYVGTPRPAAPTVAYVLTAADVAAVPNAGVTRLVTVDGAASIRAVEGEWGGASVATVFDRAGNLGPWQLQGGMADVRGTALEVAADWTDPAAVVALPSPMVEGRFRVLVEGGAWYLSWRGQENGAHYAVWSADGNVQVGGRAAGGALTLSGLTPAPAGPYWVEVSVGPAVAGQALALVRVWPSASARPVAAQIVLTPADGIPLIIGPGEFRLSSIGAPARYLAFQVDGLALPARATFLGHWVPRFEGDLLTYWTPDQGAEIRFRVSGTPSVTLRSVGTPTPGNTPELAPILAYSVDGGPRVTVRLSALTGSVSDVVIPTPGPGVHTVSVVADGIHESADSWVLGHGWAVQDVLVGGGVMAPWASGRLIAQFGDSITAGIVARGYDPTYTSSPAVSAGSVAYPRLAAEALGANVVQVGHGGTGLTVAGSGGYPAVGEWVFEPMRGHPLTGEPVPDVVIIAHGTNDAGHGASGAAVQAALVALGRTIQARYPTARLCVLPPFTGAYLTEMQAAAATLGATFIDTTGWIRPEDTVDALHPSIAGHARAGVLLAAALRTVFGPGFFS